MRIQTITKLACAIGTAAIAFTPVIASARARGDVRFFNPGVQRVRVERPLTVRRRSYRRSAISARIKKDLRTRSELRPERPPAREVTRFRRHKVLPTAEPVSRGIRVRESTIDRFSTRVRGPLNRRTSQLLRRLELREMRRLQ